MERRGRLNDAEADGSVVTTITLSPRLWRALKALAAERALEGGKGRPSASGVVADLIEREAALR